MARFKEKLYRFMYGRYGTDQFYSFLMVLFFIVWGIEIIAVAIIPEGLVQSIVSIAGGVISTLLLVYMVFRSMSRNIYKRRRENERYLKVSRAMKRFFGGNTSRKTQSFNRDDARYIFRDCTKCGSVLRLPRREGRHRTKCPRCSHSFYVKAKKFKYKAPRF
jgi:hypothetical protein